MTEKERYATVGTWERVFREEGCCVSDETIRKRLKEAGIIGETARNQLHQIIKFGFYSESDVRRVCFDLLNPLDSAYFQDSEKIRADLLAYAGQLGENQTPFDLNTGNMATISITCQNGRVMKGETYLNTATKALGFAEDNKEANSRQAQTLKDLLKIAGFEIFDQDYFQNADNLKADFAAFAAHLGPDKTPIDFNTHNIREFSITCRNGQVLSGATYMDFATRALGFGGNSKDLKPLRAQTLQLLLKSAGFEPFGKEYFENAENLRSDLTALAVQLGDGKTPLDLNGNNIWNLSITCRNGRAMKGAGYLDAAIRVLKFAGGRGDILKHLLKTAGFEIFDQDYFQNPDNLKADFEAFAVQLGPDKTPFDLNTHNIGALSIVCQNGLAMTGQPYIYRVAVALGYAVNIETARHKMAETLDGVRRIIGFNRDIPRANADGFFEIGDQTYGTIASIARLLEVSQSVIKSKIEQSCMKPIEGTDPCGKKRDFYCVPELQALCQVLLQDYPHVNDQNLIEIDGETYGAVRKLAGLIEISSPTILNRIQKSSLKPIQAKDRGGRIFDFYSLSEIQKLCSDLITKREKA